MKKGECWRKNTECLKWYMHTHFKRKLFSARWHETYLRTDSGQLEPTECWGASCSGQPCLHLCPVLRAPEPAGTAAAPCSWHLLYFLPVLYIYIHQKIQNSSLHFHKFWQICLTPNKTQDVPIIPEISLQQLFSLNFPPQNSHCSDFSPHQFLYALLELHINRIIQYVISLCVASITQLLVF